jgi:hypothetical protein
MTSEAAAPSTHRVRRAFLHVGAPKTGTTYLQGILWRNRTELRRAGLHTVGQGRGDHYRAGHDIRGVEYIQGDPVPDWAGSWDLLAKLAVNSEAQNVVISDEHLASLTPEQVARAVRSLAPREVHVIYASRNLARLLPSEYQEFVKHRSVLTYPEWVRRVFASRTSGPGKWFWSVHDPVDVVNRWTTALPPEQFHLLTMPPAGSPKDALWVRFASVVGVDPSAATDFEVAGNDSLGMAETEVLRRVNKALPDSFPRWYHTGLARDVLATKILGPRSSSGRPELPPDLAERVRTQTEANIVGLKDSAIDLVGDLNVLEVTDDLSQGEPEPTPDEIIDAAVAGIAGLLVEMGQMRDNRRKAEGRLRHQLTSSSSAVRYRTRIAAVLDRTRLGSAALSRYRRSRENSS